MRLPGGMKRVYGAKADAPSPSHGAQGDLATPLGCWGMKQPAGGASASMGAVA